MIYLNNSIINPTIFPDNTSQIWHLDKELLSEISNITWEFQNEGELVQLAQLKMLLDKYEINNIVLTLKYLPYGRQDKEITNDSTFALRTFAKLINTLNFPYIRIIDPHSDTALKLINNSHATYAIEQLSKVLDIIKPNLFCYPDKGALSKYIHVYDGFKYIYGEKIRDQATGNILKYTLNTDHDIKGKNVLIVDDICDGGATFCFLTKALYEAGVKEVNLFVTHGIFSKGLKPLLDVDIKRIFCQDGEATEYHNQLAYRRL